MQILLTSSRLRQNNGAIIFSSASFRPAGTSLCPSGAQKKRLNDADATQMKKHQPAAEEYGLSKRDADDEAGGGPELFMMLLDYSDNGSELPEGIVDAPRSGRIQQSF